MASNRLRAALNRLGVSEKVVAKRAGLSQPCVNKAKKRPVTIETSLRISRALDGEISPFELLAPEDRRLLRWWLRREQERLAERAA